MKTLSSHAYAYVYFDKEGKSLMNEIEQYIEESLFKTLYVLHPEYSISGKLNEQAYRDIKELGTQVIINVDRNVLSDLFMAIKNGCFDACKNRKETTAFLLWIIKNNFGLSPYDAIKEQAFIEVHNKSGNKEIDLFNFFFDYVTPDVIMHAFYEENVRFQSRTFQDASEEENYDFLPDNADFLFLYASILHLVFELRSDKLYDEQFESMVKWYFEECLISQVGLTYCILLFTKDGITRPHNYMNKNNKKVIHGCKNEAMDIYYFQEIDPRRYQSDKYTFLVATHDSVMRDVFENAFDFTGMSSKDDFLIKLCSYAPEVKRNKYIEIVLRESHNHKNTKVNSYNAYDIARKLCDQEEARLMKLLENR